MPESIGFTPEQGKALETFYASSLESRTMEFEVRFGSFQQKGNFVPGVTIDTFQRVQKYLNQYVAPKHEISVDSIYILSSNQGGKRIRKTELLNEKGKVKETSWMIKNQLTKIDLHSFNTRISIANEEIISPQISNIEPSLLRKKQRISYTIKQFRYDLTTSIGGDTLEAISGEGKTPMDYTYEVEVEYIGGAKTYLEFYDELLESVNRVLRIIQNSYFITSVEETVSVKKKYQKLVSRPSSFFRLVGNQPLTFHQEHIDIVSQGYSVTDKTDGDRAQLFVVETGRVYILMGSGDVVSTGLINEEHKNTILDGEFLHYTKLLQKDPTNLFLAFDIIVHRGKSLVSDAKNLLENRHILVNEVSKSFKHVDITPPYPSRYTRVQLKKFLVSQNIFKDAGVILSYFDKEDKKPYNIDGLIFTPVNVPYLLSPSAKNQITYKWKPPHESTIDMYGVIVGPARKNPEYNVWHLWIGAKRQEHFVMPDQSQFPLEYIPSSNKMEVDGQTYTLFQPTEKPNAFETYIHQKEPFYTNTVIEFRFDLKMKYFVPSRTRWDKVYSRKGPNFIVSAMDVWKSIENPVTREMLVRGPVSKGTGTPAPGQAQITTAPVPKRKESEVYHMRLFHNSIKQSQLVKFVRRIDTDGTNAIAILDLASGKGGDLQKYPKGAYVVGFDINKASVEEARRRASSLLEHKRISGEFHFFHTDVSTTNVHDYIRQNTDLADPSLRPFDLVNCQFAIHFFFRTEQTLQMFFTNVVSHLKNGGYFIGTAFDGRKVFEALESNDGLVSNDTFTIKRKYNSPSAGFDSLDLYGQEIEVYLGGDTVMSDVTLEYLVNFEKLERYAKNYGLVLEEQRDFKSLYTSDKRAKFPMTANEKEYSFLNVSFAFRLEKEAKSKPADKEVLGTVDDILHILDQMKITDTLENVTLGSDKGEASEAGTTDVETGTDTGSESESESGSEEERPVENAGLTRAEFERRLARKPCGPSGPRLTRAEVVEMAKYLNIKGVSKKNMKDLCQEIELNK